MRDSLSRLGWRMLAYGAIGLGTAGLVVPLLPTTPFLLVAAWAAPKGSPRLARWLWQHPRLGPSLHAWQEQRAIPRRTKQLAVALLVLSWLVLWLGGAPGMVMGVTAAIFCCVATFLVTRPDATPLREEGLIESSDMIRRF
ncbi:MAG: YbaN family protein [Halomonas sp.]|nr:YbaN family protein [Halomonas sp.]MCC5881040.1 YbaN family protein [Halomonas sp.]